jgi:rubrerythrin
MKNTFPGYCKKSDNEIKKIWENGIILFDTNVLLNLYRYSDSTRDTILDLISKFSKQIYLPHQAGLEYNRNRYEVIAEQEKAYKEFLDKITQIQKDLQSTNKPPFLSTKIDKNLNSVFEDVSAEVQESIQKYCDYLKDDPIYNKISELFENRITEPFTIENLDKVYKEGEERYKMKIPPGFEDEKTKDGIRKFGDLILWKQVIEKAKELKKDVILITDERKIDWWWKIKDGRNMGPRQELVEEIKNQANVDFHMYSSERFLSYGQSFLKEQINQQALQEIQAMKKAEMEEIKRLRYREFKNSEIEIKLKDEITYLRSKIESINEQKFVLNKRTESLFKESIENPEIQEYIHNISIHEAELEEHKNELNSRIEMLHKKLNKARHIDDEYNKENIRKWNYFSDENRNGKQ